MGSRHFADDKRPRNTRFPPVIDGKAAVIVLGTDGDFERLFVQIDAVLLVDLHGGRIHVGQALDGGLLQRSGVPEVLERLRLQLVDVERLHGPRADGVLAEVQEDPPALLILVEDEDVRNPMRQELFVYLLLRSTADNFIVLVHDIEHIHDGNICAYG